MLTTYTSCAFRQDTKKETTAGCQASLSGWLRHSGHMELCWYYVCWYIDFLRIRVMHIQVLHPSLAVRKNEIEINLVWKKQHDGTLCEKCLQRNIPVVLHLIVYFLIQVAMVVVLFVFLHTKPKRTIVLCIQPLLISLL